MDFNLNININNSFNKKDNSRKKNEDVFNNVSTLNNSKNILETYSASIGSITSAQLQNDFKIVKNLKKHRDGIWKQVLVSIISGVIGTVLGALITYFIFGIK